MNLFFITVHFGAYHSIVLKCGKITVHLFFQMVTPEFNVNNIKVLTWSFHSFIVTALNGFWNYSHDHGMSV